MHPFRRLNVWRKSHELTLRVYEATSALSERRFPGLTSQLRQSASSIPVNIIDATGRETPVQFAQFLDVALTSARELEYYVLLASDLGAVPASEHVRLTARIDEVCRMLVALRKTVRAKGSPSPARRRGKRALPPAKA
jgi:four helix bundle protein